MGNPAYYRPDSLDEALAFLDDKGDRAAVIAGGTDIMVDLRAGELDKTHLVDISRLTELRGIELTDQGLSVGATTTLSQIHRSGLLKEKAPALWRCSAHFASHQIRNKATIGGNVAHASPCGDTIPPLVIHEAEALVAGREGTRRIPVEKIAASPYRSCLMPDEILTHFILKPHAPQFFDFQKIGRRRELVISRMSMAYMADLDDDGRIGFIRLSLGACTPTPHRMETVESQLLGRRPTRQRLWEIGGLLAETMIEITGRRLSTIYKEPAIQGLFMRMTDPMVAS